MANRHRRGPALRRCLAALPVLLLLPFSAGGESVEGKESEVLLRDNAPPVQVADRSAALFMIT